MGTDQKETDTRKWYQPLVCWGEGNLRISPLLSFAPTLKCRQENYRNETTTCPVSQMTPNNLQGRVLSLPIAIVETRKLKTKVLKSFPQTTQLVRTSWARETGPGSQELALNQNPVLFRHTDVSYALLMGLE